MGLHIACDRYLDRTLHMRYCFTASERDNISSLCSKEKKNSKKYGCTERNRERDVRKGVVKQYILLDCRIFGIAEIRW